MSILLILELQLSDPKPTRRCIGPQYNLRRDQNRMEMKQKKKKEKHKQKKTEEVKQREVFQTASDRTKHIKIQHHWIQKVVKHGDIKLQHCPTEEMVADVLTKPLGKRQLFKLRSKLGMIESKPQVS